MREKVEAVLEQVRPMLKADGGDVELVEITNQGIVKVRLQGACKGCPMSQVTLKNAIERTILKAIPEVKGVEPAD
jgi:Fe-S cluster biogenesis protein NfuA